MTRENLSAYKGRNNVTKITNEETGSVSYLTQSVSFGDETFAKGACKLNTVESEKKHVLFLFNDAEAEVGRYYLGKNLQGKTPEELVEMKHVLCFFESFNAEANEGAGAWVPCVGLSKQENLAKKAVSF